MDELKVYLVNLGRYNENEPTGAWFTLPLDYDQVRETLKLDATHEEYAIHDYELPIKISEYESLERLNRIYHAATTISETPFYPIINDLVEAWFTSIEDLAENLDELHMYQGDVTDLARRIVDEGVFGDVSDNLKFYIDFQRLGEVMLIDGNYLETTAGLVEYSG
ncbi:antirestriction protein ArdA [Furfurilactobacillus milii]|uniref:Antirestriction protein ArdA n=1 Tax=Furfurilactobacillus milii TaxID=2888272 RepID=A0A6N9HZF0_9LACO|nr:antirestriction protein ArdA [Furfurilactobacillus milii]MYV16060.1 antirestriction protein ArdA [Furfurilactobacillus milii]